MIVPAITLFLARSLPVAPPQDPAPVSVATSRQQDSDRDNRPLPLVGKITSVQESSLQVHSAEGNSVTVQLTSKTEFRKDRHPAKRTDFKVGDFILVRGEENPDHSWTAEVIGARSMNQGEQGGRFAQGTLGKDYVVGEIKFIDAPRLSVLRSDNVTQTFELTEDTSLRKGRDAITMADIQPGDHVFARGTSQKDAFVPQTVVIIGPEQWKRMEEFRREAGAGGDAPRRRSSPPAGTPAPQEQKPPESPN